jgi:hypothetical protein
LGVSIPLATNNQPNIIMKIKESPLPYFTELLKQQPSDRLLDMIYTLEDEVQLGRSYYKTNKHLANHRFFAPEEIYELLCGSKWELVESAPEHLYAKQHPTAGVNMDVLWAEKQIQTAFDLA